jgi:serine/threonine protein kinase
VREGMPVRQRREMNGWFGVRVTTRSPVAGQAAVQKNIKGQLADELAILTTLGEHPNIVRIFFTASTLHMLVLEACTTSLEDILADGQSFDLTSLVHNMLCALTHMHQKRIAHHDIKPANILLGPDQHIWKLCDFGNSIFTNDSGECVPLRGYTMPYASPELVFFADLRLLLNGIKADMWSLAVTILHAVCSSVDERNHLLNYLSGSIVLNRIYICPEFSSVTEFACVQPVLKNLEKHMPLLAHYIPQLFYINPIERLDAKSLLKILYP